MERHRPIQALILDLDGTLVDLATDLPAMAEELAPLTDGTVSGIGAMLASLSVADRGRAFEIVARHEKIALARAVAIEGAGDLLAGLAGRGVPFAIVSRNSRCTVGAVFTLFGWPSPRIIVGLEDAARPKPDPEAGLIALHALAVAAARCAVVGDTFHDMDMGAALRCLRVLRRNPRLAWIPVEKADLIVDSPNEVLALLDQI